MPSEGIAKVRDRSQIANRRIDADGYVDFGEIGLVGAVGEIQETCLRPERRASNLAG
jgi:hypothetical protein